MESKDEIAILKEKLKKSNAHQKELRKTVAELNDFMENGSLPLHCVNGSGVIIWAKQVEFFLVGPDDDTAAVYTVKRQRAVLHKIVQLGNSSAQFFLMGVAFFQLL